MLLAEEEKRELLALARTAIESHLRNSRLHSLPKPTRSLMERHGVFVTLRIGKDLRGCIGYIEPKLPLVEAVEDAARRAAFEDPRFPPLQSEELDLVSLEISVLSPPEVVSVIDSIEVGKHGLILEAGSSRRGLLLPQVATEFGWNREQFLDHLCLKAGLPPGTWKGRDVSLRSFTTNTFSEAEHYQPH